MMKKGYIVLVRHGQSEWNKQNLFTGWVDVSLSKEGVEEAHKVGKALKNVYFDIVFTSSLIRAQTTAAILLSENEVSCTPVVLHPQQTWATIHSEKTKEMVLPVIEHEALNERMYGDLQGKNKQETKEQFGEQQVQIWRRSFDVAPPHGESLKMTSERTLPYFLSEIMKEVEEGKSVLVVAHGNSIRAILKHIENLSDEQIVKREIATGEPLCYEYGKNQFMAIGVDQLLHKENQ